MRGGASCSTTERVHGGVGVWLELDLEEKTAERMHQLVWKKSSGKLLYFWEWHFSTFMWCITCDQL